MERRVLISMKVADARRTELVNNIQLMWSKTIRDPRHLSLEFVPAKRSLGPSVVRPRRQNAALISNSGVHNISNFCQ
jgi:hypothetical protein